MFWKKNLDFIEKTLFPWSLKSATINYRQEKTKLAKHGECCSRGEERRAILMHKLPATHPLFTLGWEPKDFWWCCCCCYQVTFFYYYSPAPPFPKSIHLHLFAGKEERHAQKSSANCLLLYFYYLMDRPVYHITGGEGGGGGREKRRRKTTSDASTARLQLERSLLEEEGGRGETSWCKKWTWLFFLVSSPLLLPSINIARRFIPVGKYRMCKKYSIWYIEQNKSFECDVLICNILKEHPVLAHLYTAKREPSKRQQQGRFLLLKKTFIASSGQK